MSLIEFNVYVEGIPLINIEFNSTQKATQIGGILISAGTYQDRLGLYTRRHQFCSVLWRNPKCTISLYLDPDIDHLD